MSRQLLLPANTEGESSFSSFYAADNAALLAELQAMARGEGVRRTLYFWGEGGSGKSHLLHACCQLARQRRRPAAYLSAAQLAAEAVPAAEAWPHALVCVDDFQAAAGRRGLQSALFAVHEKLRGHHGALVVAADQPLGGVEMGRLKLELKDLESRLLSGAVHRLKPLNEQDKRAALKARARHKGFELNEPALAFILTYYRRDAASLFALLERIDGASLAAHRKVTVPFIKSLLQSPGGDGPGG